MDPLFVCSVSQFLGPYYFLLFNLIYVIANLINFLKACLSSSSFSMWISKQLVKLHTHRHKCKYIKFDYAKAFDCVDHNKLWKTLKEMGIPDHLTCLLRNLYASQEATVRTRHGTTDGFQIGKGVHQGCILSPCLFNLYAEYIMRNAGPEDTQAGSRLLGEISITSDMQMILPLCMKVKRN